MPRPYRLGEESEGKCSSADVYQNVEFRIVFPEYRLSFLSLMSSVRYKTPT